MAVEIIVKAMFICSPSVLHSAGKSINISFTALIACLYYASVIKPGDVAMLTQHWVVLEQQWLASNHPFNQHHRWVRKQTPASPLYIERITEWTGGWSTDLGEERGLSDRYINLPFLWQCCQIICKWLEQLTWNTKQRSLNQRLLSAIESPDFYFLSYSWTQFPSRKWGKLCLVSQKGWFQFLSPLPCVYMSHVLSLFYDLPNSSIPGWQNYQSPELQCKEKKISCLLSFTAKSKMALQAQHPTTSWGGGISSRV